MLAEQLQHEFIICDGSLVKLIISTYVQFVPSLPKCWVTERITKGMWKVGKVPSILHPKKQIAVICFINTKTFIVTMIVGKQSIIRAYEDRYERWFQCGSKSRLQEMTLPAPKVSWVLSENYQQIITVTRSQATLTISTLAVTHISAG